MISADFFWSVAVAARVRVVRRRPTLLGSGDEERDLGGPGGQVLEERLGGVLVRGEVRGLGGQHEAVDRRVDAFSASNSVPRVGNGKKSRSARSAGLGRLLRRRTCPGSTSRPSSGRAASAASCQVRPAAPFAGGTEGAPSTSAKTAVTFGSVHFCAPVHQVDVELVAVEPHVEDVERAHRRPAVLVAEARAGSRPSACILSPRVLNSSHVVGTV